LREIERVLLLRRLADEELLDELVVELAEEALVRRRRDAEGLVLVGVVLPRGEHHAVNVLVGDLGVGGVERANRSLDRLVLLRPNGLFHARHVSSLEQSRAMSPVLSQILS